MDIKEEHNDNTCGVRECTLTDISGQKINKGIETENQSGNSGLK